MFPPSSIHSTTSFDIRRITWASLSSQPSVVHRVTAHLHKDELCSHLHKVELCQGVWHTHIKSPKSLSPQITNSDWNRMTLVWLCKLLLKWTQLQCWQETNLSLESHRTLLDADMMSEVTFLCWMKPAVFLYVILSTQIHAMAFSLKMHCKGVTTITPEPNNVLQSIFFSIWFLLFQREKKSNDWCWLNVNMPAV